MAYGKVNGFIKELFMKTSRFVKAALVACLSAACMCAMVACSNSGSTSGGVAATVNGTEIKEQKVTDQVQQIRDQSGLSEEDQWGQFLVENDMTPSSVRDQILDTLVEQELILQGAKELGITVEDSEIDEYVNNMKANYDGDEAWNKALEQAGFTEDSYRETLKESLYEQKVGEHFEEVAQVSDEDYVTQAQTYASYYDGAKRSSHILFSVSDSADENAMNEAKAKADEVRAQIEAGTLSFEDAVTQYSGDEGSKANGGDVGWDVLNSFVTEYTDALATLAVGQLSEPVKSQYGYHLIRVTEEYKAPEDTKTITSLDQIPEGFRENIKSMAVSVKANSDYTAWLDGLKEKADIKKNDMPSGLPYDLDMSKYQKAESSASAESATADGQTANTGEGTTTEGAASGTSADASTAQSGTTSDAAASSGSASAQ